MKKLISVFLLLILVLTAFASCGDTKDTEKNPQNDPPVTEILENLNKLFKAKAKIWIHIPVISDINDSMEEMQLIKNFLYIKKGKDK